LNHLYGGLDEPEPKIIDVFICKLRKKLVNASGGKDYVETIWGRGYRLREPSDEDATPIAAAVLLQGTVFGHRGGASDGLMAKPMCSPKGLGGIPAPRWVGVIPFWAEPRGAVLGAVIV